MRSLSVALAVVMMASLSFAGGHGKSVGRFGGGRGSSSQPSNQQPRAENRQKNSKDEKPPSARDEFMRKTGYPKGRPGYVIEYIIPFSKGGTDTSVNMRWKEKAPSKAKDGSDKKKEPRAPRNKPKSKGGAPHHNR